MDQLSQTTTDTADQADREILTFTLSDEALEAAAGTGMPALASIFDVIPSSFGGCC